jgi:tripartite-type tricarboxylate transporter receptor subunit TctC
MKTIGSYIALTLVCAIASGAPAHAADYPSRPVTVITSTPAGNGPDIIARIVADGLSDLWKQRVLVENRPGGRAIVATLAVKKAPPDGYTLYVALGSTFVVLPEIQHHLPFDLGRDLVPIGIVAVQPFVIAVSPKLGVNTLSELVALSKRRPDEIIYGTIWGSLPHLAFELMQSRFGSRLKLVPYASTPQAITDVRGGSVPVVIESVSALAGAIRSGELKPLAVTAAQRLAEFPSVPTVAESLPGYEALGWFALMAPAHTPPEILEKISADLKAVLQEDATRKKYASLGTYVMMKSPSEAEKYIRLQHDVMKPVIDRIGLAK